MAAVKESMESSPKDEPVSSGEFGRLETPVHGYGKLKRGNDSNLIGRPKKEVREGLLKVVDKQAVKIIQTQLARTDLLPAEQAKWVELALRFGLGTQDETVQLKDEAVPKAMAQVLGNLIGQTMTHELAIQASKDIASLLGLQAS